MTEDEEPYRGLDYYVTDKLKPFSMLDLKAIFHASNQSVVVRSLAHLAYREPYCNTGSILFQMNNRELGELSNLFFNSEKELEPFLDGKKTLDESKNLNSISMFCLILARLEGEIEIKSGVLQTAFNKIGVMIQQETNYRNTKKNKPDYVKMSVLS